MPNIANFTFVGLLLFVFLQVFLSLVGAWLYGNCVILPGVVKLFRQNQRCCLVQVWLFSTPEAKIFQEPYSCVSATVFCSLRQNATILCPRLAWWSSLPLTFGWVCSRLTEDSSEFSLFKFCSLLGTLWKQWAGATEGLPFFLFPGSLSCHVHYPMSSKPLQCIFNLGFVFTEMGEPGPWFCVLAGNWEPTSSHFHFSTWSVQFTNAFLFS